MLGRMEESVKLVEEALEVGVRVQGSDHPDTLSSRSNLAVGYAALGRTEDSIRLLEEVLEVGVRVQGPEHPHTIISRDNLILSYRLAGRHADADALPADERFPADEE